MRVQPKDVHFEYITKDIAECTTLFARRKYKTGVMGL